jgi:hypothetical protein
MNIAMKGTALLSLATMSPVSATAQDQPESLLEVYKMPNGEVTYLDLNSVQTVGASKRYWVITRLATPDNYGVVLRRTYMEVDCNARMRAQRAFFDYDADGAVVASDGSLDRPAQWRPIVPGSNGELVRQIVCNR